MIDWTKAPKETFHWERFPNGRCVWHYRKNGQTLSKAAPKFDVNRNSVWKDAEQQKQADLNKVVIPKWMNIRLANI